MYIFIYIYNIYIYITYIYIYYIYIYIQPFVGLLTRSKPRVCRVVSMPKCDFNRVTMQFCWGHNSAWVFCEFALYFQGTSLWENLHLFFAKALLSLIVHFKGTFTYFITVMFMTHIFLIFYNFY